MKEFSFLGLIRSRKVLWTLAGVVQSIALHSLGVNPEVWLSIDGLIAVLIHSIAKEDSAEKGNPANPIIPEDI